ncbi:hypothetical protein D0Z00_000287 [Geotrichum galactomycetum]|uniref:Uncharacterized protein n=1 Tax=Geotrichum galactomycetum TaxID=27317 RepID=A0ACB6VA98_9ASCO|nr:hypothetical protein D0Z00_000287 [Geotrichum candidum]
MHLMYTLNNEGQRVYTLKKTTESGEITKSAHPARFSPDDKYSRQRSRLLLQPPGHVVVDIKVESCFFKNSCPESSKDGWYRVPKELGLGKRWSQTSFIYVKRVDEKTLEAGSNVVLDATVVDPKLASNQLPPYVINDVSPETDSESVKPLDVSNAGWVKRDHGLWIKLGKGRAKNAVTAVDVLFGEDAVDPRLSWHLSEGYIDGLASQPRLSVRIGPRQEKPEVSLRVQKAGKFKVLQLADLHFSTGFGKCLDPYPDNPVDCKADLRTLSFVTKVLDDEKPDYVVMTGDQIFGDASPDSETAMLKVVAPLIKRKIPYSMVFGNHDHEGSLSRADLMHFVSLLPYSLSESGPANISGVGNYVIQALGPKSNHPALSFYFLDSHSRSPNPKIHPGYDWIKQDQLDFIQDKHKELKPEQDEYSHIHMSMAFFHIPLPEYTDYTQQFVGQYRESCTAPRYNSGALDVLKDIGVRVLSVGHDHANNFCMDYAKNGTDVYLCYGGGTGEGGYGGYGGLIRGVRVFDVNTQSDSISTYKLLHTAPYERIDEQVLVNSGAVVPLQATEQS